MKLTPPPEIDVSAIRRPMTIARKRRIWGRCNGRCVCGVKVPLKGPGVIYDHDPPIWVSLRDVDEDVRVLCPDCDKPKTAADKGIIAHINRIIRKAAGTWKPNRKRLVGRGFDTRLSKGLDGKVTARKSRPRKVGA